jgi:hypothetical protein
MKYLLSVLFVAAAFVQTARADGGCSANVQQSVQYQANIDFAGTKVTADSPDTSEIDGGRMVTLEVPVRNTAGKIVATYSAMVGETCQVMSISRHW